MGRNRNVMCLKELLQGKMLSSGIIIPRFPLEVHPTETILLDLLDMTMGNKIITNMMNGTCNVTDGNIYSTKDILELLLIHLDTRFYTPLTSKQAFAGVLHKT